MQLSPRLYLYTTTIDFYDLEQLNEMTYPLRHPGAASPGVVSMFR